MNAARNFIAALDAWRKRPMRTCGSCTLCCKVMAITALKKPMNKWCEFCDKGTG